MHPRAIVSALFALSVVDTRPSHFTDSRPTGIEPEDLSPTQRMVDAPRPPSGGWDLRRDPNRAERRAAKRSEREGRRS